MRTMLVPCCMRLKCLPRTPLLKSRAGRGAKGSSSVAFFILFYLDCSCRAGSDEPDAGGGFSVNDEENTLPARHPDGNVATFVKGMLVVRQGRSQWVVEDGHCFGEGDSVLLEVAGGFCGVIFEDQAWECHALVL